MRTDLVSSISNVSRACTHQLVRHRHMSFSQKSQRYVKEKGQFDYLIPPTIMKNEDLKKKYEEECDALRKRNEELDSKISDLSNRLQTLMEWVVVDNNQYRSWLENELRKLNPDITFPTCKPAPIQARPVETDEHE